MRTLLSSLFVFFLPFSFLSCTKKDVKKPEAGVVITFDDAYVDEWFHADQVLKKYYWKATFNVCRIDSINVPEQGFLHQMEAEGHEIAGHGYHHYNAVKFVTQNGIQAYLKKEIHPMLVSMKRRGFHVTSFAYPYGERSPLLDSTLKKQFKIIRGRAFCGDQPEKEGCYFHGSKFVYAFDIDNSHVHFSYHYLLELLDYAKKNNKILLLCSHRPVEEVTANYQTKIETLEFVCNYVRLNHMKYYRLKDLSDWVKKE
jgi:peptidoglycan/xylan/chitin deacetylase (PgdA/CDA1 family)